jgi:phospholipase D
MIKLLNKQKSPYAVIAILVIICTVLLYDKNNNSSCFISDNPNIKITTCFSPEMKCEKAIIEQIENAKTSIYVQTYAFTSKPIANALINAANNNINVQIIADYSQSKQKYSALKMMNNTNVKLVFDKPKKGINHNKTMVIDDHIVITGSYNFTNAANFRNAENVNFIYDTQTAKHYLKNWKERLNYL